MKKFEHKKNVLKKKKSIARKIANFSLEFPTPYRKINSEITMSIADKKGIATIEQSGTMSKLWAVGKLSCSSR